MYRTEQWLQELQDKKLETPVCILSYNRPDAPVFSKKGLVNNTPELSKDDVFVFIRDTEEQYQAYKPLEDKVTLVPLPQHVEEIGLTRESILQWGIKQGYKNLFMFDDRLLSLNVLAPRLTKNGKPVMANSPETTNYKALLLWEHFHNIFPTTVSGVNGWGHCWYPENINREFTPNKPGASWSYMNVDLVDCAKYDLHFYDTREKGLEDGTFLYYALIKGLPSRVFTDLAFKEIYPEQLHKKNSNTGSNASYPGLTRNERLLTMKKLFWKNVLGLEWPAKHPGFYITKHKSEDVIFRFNFTKYWSKYYEEHKIK